MAQDNNYGFDDNFEKVAQRFEALTGMNFLEYLADPSWDDRYTQPNFLLLPGMSELPTDSDQYNEIGKYGAVVNAWRRNNMAAIQRLRSDRGTSTFEGSGGAIDVEGIFQPLKAEIDKLTAENIRLGRSSITRGAQRAEEFATEQFAGTGLGRSGVAAGTFSRIGQETAGRIESSDAMARLRGEHAKLQVDEKIAALEFSEELRERGFNELDIRSAVSFQRQMSLVRLHGQLQMAANEPTFWQEWGPVFEMVGQGLSWIIPGIDQVGGGAQAAGRGPAG